MAFSSRAPAALPAAISSSTCKKSGIAVTGWTRQDVDLLDRKAVSRAIADLKPSGVYHCAGASHVGQSFTNIGDTFAANVLGTHHLLDALRNGRCRARAC